MYAGHEGGAYAKNSFGNMYVCKQHGLVSVQIYVILPCKLDIEKIIFWNRYTAVGVFVLGRMFLEAWGTEARRKQAEFNDFLEVFAW